VRPHPFYCEENVWIAAAALNLPALVVVVTNPSRRVWCRHQRLGTDVVWDYHVWMTERRDGTWLVSDPDSALASTPLETYVETTYPSMAPSELQAWFRILTARDFRTTLRTDRRHMRKPDGGWLQPPPPWPALHPGAWNLDRFWDLACSLPPGVVCDRGSFARSWAQFSAAAQP
jgi:hypothetical protein